MTVSELKARLDEYPPDQEVAVWWAESDGDNVNVLSPVIFECGGIVMLEGNWTVRRPQPIDWPLHGESCARPV